MLLLVGAKMPRGNDAFCVGNDAFLCRDLEICVGDAWARDGRTFPAIFVRKLDVIDYNS